jgi:hypothetical protein
MKFFSSRIGGVSKSWWKRRSLYCCLFGIEEQQREREKRGGFGPRVAERGGINMFCYNEEGCIIVLKVRRDPDAIDENGEWS